MPRTPEELWESQLPVLMQSFVPDVAKAAAEGSYVHSKATNAAQKQIFNHLKHIIPRKDYDDKVVMALIEDAFAPHELETFAEIPGSANKRQYLFDKLIGSKKNPGGKRDKALGFLFAGFMRGPDDLGRLPTEDEMYGRELRRRFIEGRSLRDVSQRPPQQKTVDLVLEEAKTKILNERRKAAVTDPDAFAAVEKRAKTAGTKLATLGNKLKKAGAQDLSSGAIQEVMQVIGGVGVREYFDEDMQLQREPVTRGRRRATELASTPFKRYKDAPLDKLAAALQNEIRTAGADMRKLTKPYSRKISPAELLGAIEVAAPEALKAKELKGFKDSVFELLTGSRAMESASPLDLLVTTEEALLGGKAVKTTAAAGKLAKAVQVAAKLIKKGR